MAYRSDMVYQFCINKCSHMGLIANMRIHWQCSYFQFHASAMDFIDIYIYIYYLYCNTYLYCTRRAMGTAGNGLCIPKAKKKNLIFLKEIPPFEIINLMTNSHKNNSYINSLHRTPKEN